MPWFPYGSDDSSGWRLDVVTLLAVIGESSVADHSQAITASFLCLLPRIIPAPQALLKPARPGRMPEIHAKMAGVYSGVVLDTVGFFANIIEPLDQLQPFSFKVLHIRHADPDEATGLVSRPRPARLWRSWFRPNELPRHEPKPDRSMMMRGPPPHPPPSPPSPSPPPPLQPGITRRRTVQETMTDYLARPTLANSMDRPAVPPALYSPVHVLSSLSFLLTLALLGLAAHFHDGTAVLAIALVSLASSVVCFASWWRPILMNRSHTNRVPRGDVVIRTREGAFVLVRCTEEVARELYSGTEECEYYVGERRYKALMGLGTVVLMVAVALLGNTNFAMQVAVSASYITLNALYWAMGLLPQTYFWDLGRYVWDDVTPDDARGAHATTDAGRDPREGVKSYTRTLWYAIRETRRNGWVERSGAAPGTVQWKEWLREAVQAAREGRRDWPAVARKDEIMKAEELAEEEGGESYFRHHASPGESTEKKAPTDQEVAQHAPAQEIQRRGTGRIESTF